MIPKNEVSDRMLNKVWWGIRVGGGAATMTDIRRQNPDIHSRQLYTAAKMLISRG